MSSATKVEEQVHGVLSKAGLKFTISQNGSRFIVPYESTMCAVEVRPWGEQVVAEVKAYVLENFDATGERRAKILERLNELNRDGMFGTAYLLDREDGAIIILEHQFLGEEMEGVELMNVLGAVSVRADRLDDELIEEFESGERWADVEARRQSEHGDEPTIDA